MTARGLAAHVRDRHTPRLLIVGAVGMLGFVITCIGITRAGATSTGRVARGDRPLVIALVGSMLLYAGTLVVGSLADESSGARVSRGQGASLPAPRRSRARRRRVLSTRSGRAKRPGPVQRGASRAARKGLK